MKKILFAVLLAASFESFAIEPDNPEFNGNPSRSAALNPRQAVYDIITAYTAGLSDGFRVGYATAPLQSQFPPAASSQPSAPPPPQEGFYYAKIGPGTTGYTPEMNRAHDLYSRFTPPSVEERRVALNQGQWRPLPQYEGPNNLTQWALQVRQEAAALSKRAMRGHRFRPLGRY